MSFTRQRARSKEQGARSKERKHDSPDITFWTVWENGELLGCGALKELDRQRGEIKSMRTASAHLRKGVARAVLYHIIVEAKRRGYRRLSLETGSMAAFRPARQLYAACG